MAKPPWKPASEIAAEELAKTAGVLAAVEHGRVVKLGRSGLWDMAQEWEGHTLVACTVIQSLWTKGWMVRFHAHLAVGNSPGTFTLSLDSIPRDEVDQIAQTYMAILNVRRKT